MVQASHKGGAFERLMAKTLSLWMSDGKESKALVRSVLSGGWGMAGSQGWRQAGDLAPNTPEGEEFRRLFVVECKHRKGIDFWHYFTASPGENIMGWWEKLIGECQEIQKENGTLYPYPLLLFRLNHRPIMAATLKEILDPSLAWPLVMTLNSGYQQGTLAIITLDDFLQTSFEHYSYQILHGESGF